VPSPQAVWLEQTNEAERQDDSCKQYHVVPSGGLLGADFQRVLMGLNELGSIISQRRVSKPDAMASKLSWSCWLSRNWTRPC